MFVLKKFKTKETKKKLVQFDSNFLEISCRIEITATAAAAATAEVVVVEPEKTKKIMLWF